MWRDTPTSSIAESLAVMKERYAAMSPPTVPADAHSRALTQSLTEILLTRLAEVDEAHGDRQQFVDGTTHALANVLTTLSSYMASGNAGQAKGLGIMICAAIKARTDVLLNEPTRNAIVQAANGGGQ